MKKFTAILIAFVLALSCCLSCSQKDDPSEVSVDVISVPDELKADDSDPESGTVTSEQTHESQNESSSKTDSSSLSESDSDSNSQSSSDSRSSSNSEISESGRDSSSLSESSKDPAAVTTTRQHTAVTTVTTKSNAVTQAKTTTTAKITTTAAVTTTYPEGASIISLGSAPTVSGSGVSVSGKNVAITAGGIYYACGTLSDGQISVYTGEGNAGEADVDLYLADANITCSNGPAINVINAKRFTLHLVDGTSSTISDGGTDDIANAALFSNDTVEIRGKGSLTVYGNNTEGIASDDDIIVHNGNIRIFAVDDGLNANDDITIEGGYVYIEASGDGIDSLGTTVMSGGTTVIAKTGANESAIESDGNYTINGGTLIAIGGTGEIKGAYSTSAQSILTMKFDSTIAASNTLCIRQGSTVLTMFKPASNYAALTFTCPELVKGQDYDIYAGGTAKGKCTDGVYDGSDYSGGLFLKTVLAS